ncbi:MAG: dihydroorotase [Lachnospiraceae bacterium]|nr:dihydroorotase [Lachnospiraceae bacterium]
MGKETITIKGGRVLDPVTETYTEKDLCIKTDGASRTIDATGCIVTAGLVDPHVHFRDPGQTQKEDIFTGAAAAARGGYTSVIMMGNTDPHPDNPETLRYMIEKGKRTPLHVYASANVTIGMQGSRLTDMETLAAEGAVLFTDDGLPITDEEVMRSACKKAASLNKMISLHEEAPDFVRQPGVHAGSVAKEMGLEGASEEAEITMVARDIAIARETGCSVTVQHISAAASVALIREAKKTYPHIHAEATPHHFSLTQEAVRIHGALAKMNPPLRTEEDRLAIIEGLKDGTIDMIATDHAPHTKEEKEREFVKAPSGIIGLETALSLGIKYLVQPGHLTLARLIRLMTYLPAVITGIPAGTLDGEIRDVVVFDPEATWVAGHYRSKASNSPFTGMTLPGVVKMTICKGNVVYEAG